MNQKLLKMMLLLCALIVESGSIRATEGDEITSIANIVDGQSYYIKGVRSNNTYYLTFTDMVGQTQSGTESSTTSGAQLITFHKISDGVYTLKTATGNYIAPGTSNGKINVSSSAVNVTASNQSSKIRLSIVSGTTTWSIQKNTQVANFGGYKNTQSDITLIEGPTSAGTSPSNFALVDDPITLNFDLFKNKDAQEISYTTDGTGDVTVVANDYVDATVNTETKKITISPKKVTGSTQTITVNQAF